MKRTLTGWAALAAVSAASAQSFAIEGAVLDSRTSQNLGVTSERGAMADFFRAQKTMTFGILRAAGVSLDQLSPDVRARIERFQTTNLDAFRAYAQGLDLKDQGRFQEAKEAFRRAAELDPNFQLAVEQQQAMPDVNVTTALQLRAVVAAASTAAVDRGKAGFTVDLSRAVAALASGLTVVAVPATTERQALAGNEYTSNPPGASGEFLPSLAAGLAYAYPRGADTVALAFSSEYLNDNYRAAGGTLEAVSGSKDAQGNAFAASRGGSAVGASGNATLADGTQVYWGRWLATTPNGATVTVQGVPVSPPDLGPVDFMFAEATRQMPQTGSVTFTPRGGSFTVDAGTISVNFATRGIDVNNLGFTLGGFQFTNMSGSTTYGTSVASGGFSGTYTSGSCSNCPASLGTGIFGGNFVGREAAGLVFSTVLPTGGSGATPATVSGVQLFGR